MRIVWDYCLNDYVYLVKCILYFHCNIILGPPCQCFVRKVALPMILRQVNKNILTLVTLKYRCATACSFCFSTKDHIVL